MHKKLISTVALSLILLAPTISNANSNLSDINNHWAKKEIENFISNGYISGYPESNTFKPDNTITRAEFVKIVNRYFNFTEGSYSEFEDVVSDKWYYKEIAIAENIGYINGKTSMFFEPNSPITREEVAKIITTITNTLDYNYDKLNSTPDGSNVSNWAKPYVEGALEQGYIRGNDSGYINPKNNISRAEAVVILSRVANNTGEGDPPILPENPDYGKDNVPPVIELKQDTVELNVGEKYVVNAITNIFDFYDPDKDDNTEPLDIQVDVSKVDTSKPGTYEALILVSDIWDTTTATVKVIVKEVSGITNPNSSEFKAIVANEMYALVNAHRVANGKAELVTLDRLECMANAWSKHIADTGVFDHVIDGKNVMETFPEFGESDLENIAATTISGNSFTEEDAKSLANKLFTMWNNSTGHNNSMLDKWNKSIGFGFYAKETSPGMFRIYATQEFYGLTSRVSEKAVELVQE